MHEVMPVEAHAPTPHMVGSGTYPSSTVPSQLSSTPSQVTSDVPGVPGVQLSETWPALHEVAPVAAHAPTPQVVDTVA
jgi:hypothetical protein